LKLILIICLFHRNSNRMLISWLAVSTNLERLLYIVRSKVIEITF